MYTTFCVSRERPDRFIKLFVTARYAMQGCPSLAQWLGSVLPGADWQTKKPKPLDADVGAQCT